VKLVHLVGFIKKKYDTELCEFGGFHSCAVEDCCPVGHDGKCSTDFSNELALRYSITSQKTRIPDTEFITVVQVYVN